MRSFVLAISLVLIPGSVFAGDTGNVPEHIAGCLPPSAAISVEPEKCDLGHSSPPRLRQDVDVYDCRFLRTGSDFLSSLDCLVYNGSNEPIEHFKYGVRIVDPETETVVLESGFEGPARYGTAVIAGTIRPEETLALRLAGPSPRGFAHKEQLVPVVDVLTVFVPGSSFRR